MHNHNGVEVPQKPSDGLLALTIIASFALSHLFFAQADDKSSNGYVIVGVMFTLVWITAVIFGLVRSMRHADRHGHR